MLLQIANLLLQIFSTLFAGACLIRCFLQWQGFNIALGLKNPISAYLFLLSNWIVLPLRRILPATKRVDIACVVGAYLIILAKVFILTFLILGSGSTFTLFIFAFFDLIDLSLSGLVGMVIVNVVLSWIAAGSPTQYLLNLMIEPLLKPIRHILPNMGPLDLSPLILLLALQIMQIIVANLKLTI